MKEEIDIDKLKAFDETLAKFIKAGMELIASKAFETDGMAFLAMYKILLIDLDGIWGHSGRLSEFASKEYMKRYYQMKEITDQISKLSPKEVKDGPSNFPGQARRQGEQKDQSYERHKDAAKGGQKL